MLPDSTILLHYLLYRATALVEGLVVHPARMRENLELTCGALFSQRVLLALVRTGMTRDDAYRIAQRLAQQAWDERTPLRDLLAAERPDLPRTRSSTSATSRGTRARSSAGSTPSFPRPSASRRLAPRWTTRPSSPATSTACTRCTR